VRTLLLACMAIITSSAYAVEGPPQANGVISNPTLVANSAIAKAQAVGAITTFMGKGTETCDDDGKNCRSLFGADDKMDYNSVQLNAQATTGVQAFSFASGSSADERMNSNTVASQTGTLVLACGDTAVKTVAGIAVKVTGCSVTPTGDAQMTYQVCTGPSRSNPVIPPQNTMKCSNDVTSPNFQPKPGFTCEKPTCQSEPQGSLNGWSAPQTISYEQSVAEGGSEDAKAKNGLGMVFYPALGGGTPASFSADSDNMTALKIVQTAINAETKQSAVGLRVAYRHKTLVTKEMMVQGPSAVPDPGKHTAAWETIVKLQGNALIPQYQQKYAQNGSECMAQLQEGIATDGIISVCDQTYTNESGIRPGALTAQVASDGQACGTTTQCLQEVVNTNTWDQTCRADVPLSLRKCTTKTDYDLEQLSFVRTRNTEQCVEQRAVNTYSCRSYSMIDSCQQTSVLSSGGVDLDATQGDTSVVRVGMRDQMTAQYRFGTIGNDYWQTGYYSRTFTVDILDPEDVKIFNMYQLAFDDTVAISINGNWVFSDWLAATYHPEYDRWGWETRVCLDAQSDGGDCLKWGTALESLRERSTSWVINTSINMIPYLRAGRNVIRIDTGVVKGGEGWAFFDISAWKMKCNTRVVNECTTYEMAQ
jgi:hypothetical protein